MHVLLDEPGIVDGIEWSYYVKEEYAVLEHPEARRNATRPKPAHSGALSDELEIPCALGGLPVREIGIGAIPNFMVARNYPIGMRI